MKFRNIRLAVKIILFFAALISLPFSGIAFAEEVDFSVYGTENAGLTLSEGREVVLNVTVNVPEGKEMSGFDFAISYPEAMLDIIEVKPSEESPFAGTTTINPGAPGLIIANVFKVGGVTGNVSLLEVTAKAKASGSGAITSQIKTMIDDQTNPILGSGLKNTMEIVVK